MNQNFINLKRDQSWRGKYILLILKGKKIDHSFQGKGDYKGKNKNVHQVMCEGDIKRLLNTTSH